MILPQNLGFSPDLEKNQKHLRFFWNLGNFPKSGENCTAKCRVFSNNFFSISLSGLKNELYYSPIDYACPWIIIANYNQFFHYKKLIKNLPFPQFWVISPVLKFFISPDLGKWPRSGWPLTVTLLFWLDVYDKISHKR